MNIEYAKLRILLCLNILLYESSLNCLRGHIKGQDKAGNE